jgi:two-component system response regulator HydG
MARILVVDDQRNMRTTLGLMLRQEGYEVGEAGSGEDACAMVAADAWDLVLTDLKLGGQDGIDVLRFVKRESPLTEVMVMTAFGTVESAVEAMKLGAHDYISKPFSDEELRVKIERALEKRSLAGQMTAMAAEFRHRYGLDSIIGRSTPIREVLGRIVRIAPTDTTVLISGESGTGKELVARAIHANSKRADRPYVSINCAAVSDTLLESELFGHVRGAFTGAVQARKGLFEEADGGTFFLDEIAETPLSFQAKLLRALQEGEIRRLGDNRPIHVDVRIIAATNQDLQTAIAEKRFRQDLFYRLAVARFQLPPLRDRRQDIPLLVDFFLRKFASKMERPAKLAEGAMDALMAYAYPGNIRELENMVEQAIALSPDGLLRAEDLLPPEAQSSAASSAASEGETLQDVVDRAEREAIVRVLDEVGGAREKAAERLGLSATTLWRRMKRLKISV